VKFAGVFKDDTDFAAVIESIRAEQPFYKTQYPSFLFCLPT
jgi:hypothetical protein